MIAPLRLDRDTMWESFQTANGKVSPCGDGDPFGNGRANDRKRLKQRFELAQAWLGSLRCRSFETRSLRLAFWSHLAGSQLTAGRSRARRPLQLHKPATPAAMLRPKKAK
jgi:hypothetical protein